MWGTQSWNQFYLSEFGSRSPFNQSFRTGVRGKIGGGADQFFSLDSIIPHSSPPSSRGPSGRGSRSGAGQPKSARHPPVCFVAARTQEQRPHRIPLPSTPGSFSWRPSASQAAAQSPGQRFLLAGSLPWALSQMPLLASTMFLPHFPHEGPWPRMTPFRLAT